jgi:hypothetical protein
MNTFILHTHTYDRAEKDYFHLAIWHRKQWFVLEKIEALQLYKWPQRSQVWQMRRWSAEFRQVEALMMA